MNKSSYQRLLSEYLDGEIGLADKAAFEAELARDPQLRAEYHAQRKAGLLLSTGMPEVNVHPYRFRQRLAQQLDGHSHGFTPQRAFAGSMAIALVVVSLAFGLYIYQERLNGSGSPLPHLAAAQRGPSRQAPVSYSATLVVGTSAEKFYDRLLIEGELGLTDQRLVAQVLQQSGALEGATCVPNDGLHSTTFAHKLPQRQALTVSLVEAQRLQSIAESLTGSRGALTLSNSSGQALTQQDYQLAHPAGQPLSVLLVFEQ